MTPRLLTLVAVLPLLLMAAAAPDPQEGAGGEGGGEAARIAAVQRPAVRFDRAEPFEARPAGAATVFPPLTADAFSQPAANLTLAQLQDFRVGNGVFRRLWVSAPASTRSSDGLGPLFNSRGCQDCHLKDGRGRLPGPGESPIGLILRLAGPDGRPHPVYGAQLQNFAIQGHVSEAALALDWQEEVVTLEDGTAVPLRRPVWRLSGFGHGDPGPGLAVSGRLATQMIGLGLLEAIPEARLLALADPEDRDGDGISGRAHRVPSLVHGDTRIGRFGWKAGQPTVADQAAAAFAGDMGLSTRARPDPAGECTAAQTACRAGPHGDDVTGAEVADVMFDLVTFYSRSLGVPARRTYDDPAVLAGKRLFHEAGCIACHVPKHVTARAGSDGVGEEVAFQLIWPYTDLLLHDMGPGLADGVREGEATGAEWRTPPLWGLGLTRTVSGEVALLHDGRARSILEAILWHGGEAEAARDRVTAMSAAERDQLIAFLESL